MPCSALYCSLAMISSCSACGSALHLPVLGVHRPDELVALRLHRRDREHLRRVQAVLGERAVGGGGAADQAVPGAEQVGPAHVVGVDEPLGAEHLAVADEQVHRGGDRLALLAVEHRPLVVGQPHPRLTSVEPHAVLGQARLQLRDVDVPGGDTAGQGQVGGGAGGLTHREAGPGDPGTGLALVRHRRAAAHDVGVGQHLRDDHAEGQLVVPARVLAAAASGSPRRRRRAPPPASR